ncbi:hypothetical protein Vretifemale_16209 [Volvox reticuliferus]|uniref:Uncharacterized protein n=1 Tax=Volvox reticuliferus TaxID=1737510 RepID=A0A8J4FSC9_9CHLO|nr:hypothetical protein Vretifemale_16209 [Volvox reticuliferus]
MRASFAVRGPGEQPEAPRGLLGFLSKSQPNHGAERTYSSYGPSSESDDDGDQNRFRYPGMPREPKPIKLTDPYPGGKLAGSRAATEQAQEVQPLEHDGSTTVLFIKAGSEHRALLYLMQKVNRYFALDDMLPEVPPDIAAYHYILLAPPKDGPVDGDAATSFRNSTLFLLSGMVLRRLKVMAKDPMALGLVDSTVMQRRLPMRKLGAKLAGALEGASGLASGSNGGSSQFARKASFAARMGPEASGGSESEMGRHDSKRWATNRRPRRNGPPELIPVAIYSHPLYLDTAASIIRNFNRTGLIVTPYLYSTVVAAAAVCTIQGWWRSHLIRGMSNFGALLKMSRAARTIQRSWRAFMLRSRLHMLSAVRRLTAMVGSLLLGANLALTVEHCLALRERAGRPRPAPLFPEQRLRYAFDRAGGLVLVEPERMMPKPFRDGNWTPGLPPPPVLRSLPEWCGVPLLMYGERAAVSVHGCREVLGLDSILQLITRDTVWRDNAGNELSRTTLPDTNAVDPGATAATIAGGGTADDVVLAIITFPSVHEAAVRAAMLSVYTWDPRRRTGVNLVPLHQTAAARGVQAQAAVVQAINTIAASAGHLVSTAPLESERQVATPPGPSGAGAMYTSTASLAWRHAPPGGRERQRGSGAVNVGTPSLELRSPIRALGGSPFASSGASPTHTGGPSGASSFSHAMSGSHHSLARSHSHSHSHSHVHSHAGSPTRTISPVRPRVGGASGGVPVPYSPGSPRRVQHSPPHAGVGTRTPSPLRRQGAPTPPPSLPPVAMRPGTVPALSTAKFRDLDPAATVTAAANAAAADAAGVEYQVGTSSGPLPALPQLQLQNHGDGGQPRPRTTPAIKREGDISPVMSLCGAEPSLAGMTLGHAARSLGGLYDTQPGAPLPLDNVPLSSLARALSPPSTYRQNAYRASNTNPPTDTNVGDGDASATGRDSRRCTDSTGVVPSQDVPYGAAYRGYDMPGSERLDKGGSSMPASTGVAFPVDAFAGADGRTAAGFVQKRVSGPGQEERAQAKAAALAAVDGPDDEVRETITPLDSLASTSVTPTRQLQTAYSSQPPGAYGGETPAAGLGDRGSVEGNDEAEGALGPPIPCEEPEQEDPYARMTVLQRHQAMGLYNDMLLLPVPRHRLGIEVEAGLEAGGYQQGADYGVLETIYYDALPQQQSSGICLPCSDPSQLQGVSPDGGAPGQGDPCNENPELVVGPMPVDYAYPATIVAELAEALGNQGRTDRHFADSSVRICKLITAEEAFARHRQLMSTLMLTQVIGRQTAVGHVQAPNYTPLNVRAMNQIVSEMRRVYRGEAAELVANMREQHKEAIAAVKQEMAAAARVVASTSCMQAAVVDSELARADEERSRAVRARATRAHLRTLRRERAMQDRAFAAAFGRQVAGASKQIVRSEIRARDAVVADATATQGAIRRQLNHMTQEHITMAATEMATSNRVRASIVRSEGWTSQVASHYHLLEQWQADLVALRRDDNYARMRRVGPAGGVWGASRPRELLRAPLPLTNVVSAAAAAAAAASAATNGSSTAAGGTGGAIVAAPATGAWRSQSAGDARHSTLAAFTPPGSGGSGDAEGLFSVLPSGVTRVSFSSVWPPFDGDHGSLAASSAPPSAMPSRQTRHRGSLLPQPLPEGYVPGGGAAGGVAAAVTPSTPATGAPPPLVENSEAATTASNASNAEAELAQANEAVTAPLRPGAKAAALAALAVANGLRQRGSPPRNLVEGPGGRLVDFLPEAYSVQPFGSRQGPNPPRPVGMVVSRY